MISDGQSGGQSITINYEQGMSNDTYSTKIDGGYFEGKAVMDDAPTTFRIASGSAHNAYGATSLNASRSKPTGVSVVHQTLQRRTSTSNQNSFHFTAGTKCETAGGVGERIHSDGRQLDFVW